MRATLPVALPSSLSGDHAASEDLLTVVNALPQATGFLHEGDVRAFAAAADRRLAPRRRDRPFEPASFGAAAPVER